MSLNKKRIGELYDLPIVTGDQNMVNNHELLLEMNDDNTPKALKQRVNGDQFKTILGDGSGGSNNPGYNVTKQTVILFDDTIETQEITDGVYRGIVENIDFDIIAGENYTVVFDGASYDVKAISADDYIVLGELSDNNPSFDTYPFFIDIGIALDDIKNLELITTIEGSHTVEIKHEEDVITATPEFKSAVDSVTGYSIEKGHETLTTTTPEFEKMVGEVVKESGTKLIVDGGSVYIPSRNGDVIVTQESEWFNKIDSGEYPDLIIGIIDDNNNQILGRKIFENKYLTQYLHTVRVNEEDYKFINYEHFEYVEPDSPGEGYYTIPVMNYYA